MSLGEIRVQRVRRVTAGRAGESLWEKTPIVVVESFVSDESEMLAVTAVTGEVGQVANFGSTICPDCHAGRQRMPMLGMMIRRGDGGLEGALVCVAGEELGLCEKMRSFKIV